MKTSVKISSRQSSLQRKQHKSIRSTSARWRERCGRSRGTVPVYGTAERRGRPKALRKKASNAAAAPPAKAED
eukprot:scaffold2352_cov153-Ochromonas_danica.AAC.10